MTELKVGTLDGKSHRVHVPVDATIGMLRKEISNVTGIQVECQTLIRGRDVLDDDEAYVLPQRVGALAHVHLGVTLIVIQRGKHCLREMLSGCNISLLKKDGQQEAVFCTLDVKLASLCFRSQCTNRSVLLQEITQVFPGRPMYKSVKSVARDHIEVPLESSVTIKLLTGEHLEFSFVGSLECEQFLDCIDSLIVAVASCDAAAEELFARKAAKLSRQRSRKNMNRECAHDGSLQKVSSCSPLETSSIIALAPSEQNHRKMDGESCLDLPREDVCGSLLKSPQLSLVKVVHKVLCKPSCDAPLNGPEESPKEVRQKQQDRDPRSSSGMLKRFVAAISMRSHLRKRRADALQAKLNAKHSAELELFVQDMLEGCEMTVLSLQGAPRLCRCSLDANLRVLKILIGDEVRDVPLASLQGAFLAASVPRSVETPLDNHCVTLLKHSGGHLTFRMDDITECETCCACLGVLIRRCQC